MFFSISIPSPSESIATSSVASSPIHNSFEDDSTLMQQFSTEAIQCEPGPSFAQMLRSEGCKITSSSTWPSIDTQGSLKNLEIENLQRKVVVSNEDDYTDMTIQNQSLGDVLAQALKQSEMLETTVGNTEFGSRKTKKKKRGKPTVLFTSGMNRNS